MGSSNTSDTKLYGRETNDFLRGQRLRVTGSTPKQQRPRLRVPMDSLDATSGIVAYRFVTLYISPFHGPANNRVLPHPGTHAYSLDKVQSRAAPITQSETQDATQQWLAH